MADQSDGGRWGELLGRIVDQARRLEKQLEESSGDEGPIWSWDWNIEVGGGSRGGPVRGESTSAPQERETSWSKSSAPQADRELSQRVAKSPLADVEVHTTPGEWVVIVERQGAASDKPEAWLMGDDIVVIALAGPTKEERREFMLPRRASEVTVHRKGPFWIIRCALEEER